MDEPLGPDSLLNTFQRAGLQLASAKNSATGLFEPTLSDPVLPGSTSITPELPDANPARPVRFLCGLSGGLDSMVLLQLLKDSGLPVRAIHVDHAANPESAVWADWVRTKAESLNVPIVVHRLTHTPGDGNLEEFWRNARRALFTQELRDDEVLVTAHHQDDQLETLLLQLFRGAGPTGLQSMPLYQRLANARLHVRPLLYTSRTHLEAYAHEHEVEYLKDPSNADTRFDRNFLRHTIVPGLKERWPSVSGSVARSAELIAEAVSLNETLAVQDANVCDEDNSFDWEAVRLLGAARQANAVRYWLKQLHVRMPNRRRLTEALRQWNEANSDRLPALELEGGTVQRYRSRLVYQPSREEAVGEWSGSLTLDQWLALPGSEGSLGLIASSPSGAEGLANHSAGPAIRSEMLESSVLTVRYRHNGEKLRRAAGHHQKLKHWFQQNEIPPVRRSRLPLVFLDTELIAIANIWVDARFRSDPHSGPEQKSCHLIWRDLAGGMQNSAIE